MNTPWILIVKEKSNSKNELYLGGVSLNSPSIGFGYRGNLEECTEKFSQDIINQKNKDITKINVYNYNPEKDYNLYSTDNHTYLNNQELDSFQKLLTNLNPGKEFILAKNL